MLKNWSILTIANIFQTVIGFAVLVKLVHILPPASYGTYVLLTSVSIIAQTVGSLSLRNIIIREISRAPAARTAVAVKALILTAAASSISAGGMVAYLWSVSGITDELLILSTVVLVFSQGVWGVCESVAFSRQYMVSSGFLTMLSAAVWMAAVMFLPEQMHTLPFIWSLFVGIQAVRSLLYVAAEMHVRRSGPFGWSDAITFRQLLKQSMPILGSALLALPLTQIPSLFLSRHSGNLELAYYGIGNRLTQPLYIVSGTLFSALYPSLSGKFVDRPRDFRRQSTIYLVLLSAGGLLFGWIGAFFGTEVVTLLFGENYRPGVAAFTAQVWVVWNWIMHNYLGLMFMASNKEVKMVQLSLFNAVLIGTASYIGSHFGAIGLSISLWCSGLIGLMVHWIVLSRAIGGLPFGSLHWKLLGTYVVLSVVSMAAIGSSIGFRFVAFAVLTAVIIILFTPNAASYRRKYGHRSLLSIVRQG